MYYNHIRATVAFMVGELQARVIKSEELVNFRLDERGGAITLAPDGRKYHFTQAQIDEAYTKISAPAAPPATKPIAKSALRTPHTAPKKPALRTPHTAPKKPAPKK